MLELVIFLVILLILLAAGYWFQAGERAETEIRRLAQDWPQTSGSVVSSSVEEGRGFKVRIHGQPFRRRIRQFKPVVSYTYQVAGQPYQSSRYQNGYLSRGGEWVTILPQKAGQIVAGYTPGQPVQVTYNPQDPALAYLVLDTSTTRQLIFRTIGYVLYAAAVLLVILEARALFQDYSSRRAASESPAVITAAASQLKTGLEQGLGLACSFDQKLLRGTYQNWDCRAPSTMVTVYVRQEAPEKADRISISLPADGAPEALAELVRLALPQVDPAQVRAWVGQTAPTLSASNNDAETSIGGVLFTLSLGYNDALNLAIGELEDF